jgi:polar amino acid transport system substrate-binding protein
MRVLTLLLVCVFLLYSASTTTARDISMVTTEWSPYYGSKLKNGGVITELVVAAFKKVKHSASIQYFPWKRALHLVRRRRSDLVMGAYYTKKRATIYYFSAPFYRVTVGLVALKEKEITKYSSLRDLTFYRIGIANGWANSKEFDTANYLRKDKATSQLLNIRKLFNNRVDMIAISFGVFKYEISQMKRYNISKVVFLSPALAQNTLHLMMSKKIEDHQQIIKDFNQGLKIIKRNGTYKRILAKHGF